MASSSLHRTHRLLRLSAFTLLLLALGLGGLHMKRSTVDAWLMRKETRDIPWLVLEADAIQLGASIPDDTNVVFHLPEGMGRISREVLLGLRGKTTRYWGYCFPANYDPKVVDTRAGFPGLLFLSERERQIRALAEAEAQTDFSLTRLPTANEVNQMGKRTATPIRHQLDYFEERMLCYIMTESTLAIGFDSDGDRINSELEREIGTDPQVPDSDGDGIWDGIEYLTGLKPNIRDTDADGIIDGIEDKDWDGRLDPGETDPRVVDTDRDGLCDGFCHVKVRRRHVYMGEDKNLNGIVDDGETSPLLTDTDGDEYSDEVEFLQCLAEGGTDCPNG